MGLFDRREDRKRGDAFDSPVETIDLNAPPPEPAAAAEADQDASQADDADPAVDYGIEQAIQLMRTLPQDNVELVVQVVKHTLESTRIQISRIIEDATQKQNDVDGRIKVLKGEIAELEQEIATRKREIGSLEADYEETTMVKERLVLAEKLGKGGADKSQAGQARATPGEGARSHRASEPPPMTGEMRSKRASESPPVSGEVRSKRPSESPPAKGDAAESTAKK